MNHSHDDATRYAKDLTDEQIEKLLSSADDDPIFDPPADLLDRLKADIPNDPSFVLAPVPLATAESQRVDDDEAGTLVPITRPWYRRQPLLALAATLVMAAGLLFLARDIVQPSSASLDEQAVSTVSVDADTSTGSTAAEARDVTRALREPGNPVERDSEASAVERADEKADRRQTIEERRRKLSTRLEQISQEDAGAVAPELVETSSTAKALGYIGTRDDGAPKGDNEAGVREVQKSVTPPPPPPVPPTAPHLELPASAADSPTARHFKDPKADRSPSLGDDGSSRRRAGANAEDRAQAAEVFVDNTETAIDPEGVAEELEAQKDAAQRFVALPVVQLTDASEDSQSTFGLDVDTASYSVVRAHLQQGLLPPRAVVRVEEMVNYFDYGDAPPRGSDDFAITAEGAPAVGTPDRDEPRYLLRMNVRARDVADEDRPPALLTFVVDVSGSMRHAGKLEMVKRSLEVLLDELQDGDRLGLVTYGSSAQIVLPPTEDHEAVRRALSGLTAGGSTNAEAGLRLGYQVTTGAARRSGEIRRVILCSDGVANVGLTSGEGILEQVRSYAQEGVELTTIGVGMGTYNDVLLETLADRGNGRYAYVDTEIEAQRIFAEQLTGTLMTVAAEARAQVTFNPHVVARYRLLGYENRDIADDRFRDDSVDAGEIGAGHQVTALYEIETFESLGRRDEVAVIELRYGSVAKKTMVEQKVEVHGQDFERSFERTSRAFRLSAVVAELAENLRGTRRTDLDELFRRSQRVARDYPGNVEVAELVSLVGRAAKIRAREG